MRRVQERSEGSDRGAMASNHVSWFALLPSCAIVAVGRRSAATEERERHAQEGSRPACQRGEAACRCGAERIVLRSQTDLKERYMGLDAATEEAPPLTEGAMVAKTESWVKHSLLRSNCPLAFVLARTMCPLDLT
ncbi:hypothetical protein AOLI_G00088270 [Acnodon oligacanthus]